MNELEKILPLWRELETTGVDYVLATVVAVEGSSYRKPGARMLLTQDGRRAGTISGGCLEAEVARRAWWLTSSGPAVERYSTQEDDDDRPYGSGCGGVVNLLLERRQTAGPLLTALDESFKARIAVAVATVLEGPHIGSRADSRFAKPGRLKTPHLRSWRVSRWTIGTHLKRRSQLGEFQHALGFAIARHAPGLADLQCGQTIH